MDIQKINAMSSSEISVILAPMSEREKNIWINEYAIETMKGMNKALFDKSLSLAKSREAVDRIEKMFLGKNGATNLLFRQVFRK